MIIMIKLYDKIKLKNGKYAIIVEILEIQKAFIADIEVSEGDYETETVFIDEIAALMVEIEQSIAV